MNNLSGWKGTWKKFDLDQKSNSDLGDDQMQCSIHWADQVNCYSCHIQLFWERLLEKVHVTILKGIVGGFEFTVLQRNLKEWHERPWTYVCKHWREAAKLGLTASVMNSVLIISHTIHLSGLSCAHYFFLTTLLEIAVTYSLWLFSFLGCSKLHKLFRCCGE